MNKKLKNTVEFVTVLAGVLLGVVLLNRLLTPGNVIQGMSVIEAFHQQEEDTIEVIGFGSSHMWRELDSLEIYENYGVGFYNYGANWQWINTTQLFIHDALSTQSPKVILIETFNVYAVLQDTALEGQIAYTRAIPWSEYKLNYLKQCFGSDDTRWMAYLFPIYQYHENWINMSLDALSLDYTDCSGFVNSMGYCKGTTITAVTIPDQSEAVQKTLTSAALAALDDIVAICEENGTDIIFYTVPYAGLYCYSDAMEEYAAEHGCVYINLFDMVDELEIDQETDFQDDSHLNASGAAKVANFFGEYLTENYDLTDMRTVEGNAWEKGLAAIAAE